MPEALGQFVDIEGSRLHYLDAGNGPPVVLLHGAGPGASSRSNFHETIPVLATRFRVLAVDLPGFGLSEPSRREGFPYQAFALTLDRLLDALSLETVSVVGNSLGGGTALQMALDFPERVERLVLMAPGGGAISVISPGGIEARVGRLLLDFVGQPTREGMRAFLLHMVFDRRLVTEELVEERFRAASTPEALAALTGFLEWTAKTPRRDLELWREAERVKQPTLLVWGRDDQVLPLDSALLLLQRLPRAQLHVFSRCGHWAQLEWREDFNQLVSRFLDGP